MGNCLPAGAVAFTSGESRIDTPGVLNEAASRRGLERDSMCTRGLETALPTRSALPGSPPWLSGLDARCGLRTGGLPRDAIRGDSAFRLPPRSGCDLPRHECRAAGHRLRVAAAHLESQPPPSSDVLLNTWWAVHLKRRCGLVHLAALFGDRPGDGSPPRSRARGAPWSAELNDYLRSSNVRATRSRLARRSDSGHP